MRSAQESEEEKKRDKDDESKEEKKRDKDDNLTPPSLDEIRKWRRRMRN